MQAALEGEVKQQQTQKETQGTRASAQMLRTELQDYANNPSLSGTIRCQTRPGLARFRYSSLLHSSPVQLGDAFEFNLRGSGLSPVASRLLSLPTGSVTVATVENTRILGRLQASPSNATRRGGQSQRPTRAVLVINPLLSHPVCYSASISDPVTEGSGSPNNSGDNQASKEGKGKSLSNADFRAKFGLVEKKAEPVPVADLNTCHPALLRSKTTVKSSKRGGERKGRNKKLSDPASKQLYAQMVETNDTAGLLPGDLVSFLLGRYTAEPSSLHALATKLAPKLGTVLSLSGRGGAIQSHGATSKDFTFQSNVVVDGLTLEQGDTVEVLECGIRSGSHDIRHGPTRFATSVRLVKRASGAGGSDSKAPVRTRRVFKSKGQLERERTGQAPIRFRPRHSKHPQDPNSVGFQRDRVSIGYFPAEIAAAKAAKAAAEELEKKSNEISSSSSVNGANAESTENKQNANGNTTNNTSRSRHNKGNGKQRNSRNQRNKDRDNHQAQEASQKPVLEVTAIAKPPKRLSAQATDFTPPGAL